MLALTCEEQSIYFYLYPYVIPIVALAPTQFYLLYFIHFLQGEGLIHYR